MSISGTYSFGHLKFSMLKDVVCRRSKTPTWACAETHHVGLCEYRPTRSMLKAVVGRRSKTLTWACAETPSCRTLRVPTCEMTVPTHFKLQRAGSIGHRQVNLTDVGSKSPTYWRGLLRGSRPSDAPNSRVQIANRGMYLVPKLRPCHGCAMKTHDRFAQSGR